MPGPWLSATRDPEAWRALEFSVGDYFEFIPYDSTHTRQGFVLAKVETVAPRSATGQWLETSFLAVSDGDLGWWLDSGGGAPSNWQFDVHLCKGGQRACTAKKRGRSLDFHADRVRQVFIGDLADQAIEWVKHSSTKKFVEEEVKKMAGDSLGGVARDAPHEGGLRFEVSPAKAAMPKGEGVLEALSELEKDLGNPRGRKRRKEVAKASAVEGERVDGQELRKKKKKKKKRRAASAPSHLPGKDGGWFGKQPAKRAFSASVSSSRSSSESEPDHEKSKKKKRAKKHKKEAKASKDRGPFGVGREVSYNDTCNISSESSEDRSVFREGPPSSSGKSLQLQLKEYHLKHPGRLAARLLQKMQIMVSKEGGPRRDSATSTPAVAVNWVLTVLLPLNKQALSIRQIREIRTLAQALDLIASGNSQSAADIIAQRLKALELSISDAGWSRAQFVELLEPEGPTLLDRDEMAMTSKELSTDLKMRRLQLGKGGKGDGKDPKGSRKGEKGDQGGKGDGKKGRKGKEQAPAN